MLRRSIGSRCHTQVTSNVRLPRTKSVRIHRRDTRSGLSPHQENSRQGKYRGALSTAETTGAGFTTAPTRSQPQVSMDLVFKPLRFARTRSPSGGWSVQKVSQLNLPPSKDASHGHQVNAAGSRYWSSARKYCAAGLKFMASFGHQPSGSGSAMSQVSRKPNPSVNVTRNSVPHWPGIARYAHNAMPGQRGPLLHARYLKR
jgi:hypothetical protein